MKKQYLIAVVAIILILGGLFIFTTVYNNVQEQDLNTGALSGEDSDSPKNGQGEAPSDWKVYQNSQVDFTFKYPPRATITSDAGLVTVTYLGTGNAVDSEITDGYLLAVRMIDADGQSLAEVARRLFEEERTGLEAVSGLTMVNGFDRDAYSYQSNTAIGSLMTHIVLEAEDENIFVIEYMIFGDVGGRYEENIRTSISTLKLDASAVKDGKVGTQTISIALLDVEYEGEPTRGCDRVVLVDREIPATSKPLTGALNELFALEGVDTEGYYNFIANTKDTLTFDHATVEDGVASVYLNGEVSGVNGACDEPRARIQIEETALQFDTVEEVQIFLNGQPTTLQSSQQ